MLVTGLDGIENGYALPSVDRSVCEITQDERTAHIEALPESLRDAALLAGPRELPSENVGWPRVHVVNREKEERRRQVQSAGAPIRAGRTSSHSLRQLCLGCPNHDCWDEHRPAGNPLAPIFSSEAQTLAAPVSAACSAPGVASVPFAILLP